MCKGEPTLGSDVFAIGDPYRFTGSISRGIVSGTNRNIHDLKFHNMIQTDALLNPGNSGGPLFDTETGCVVGMNTMIMSTENGSHTGIGFAIPSTILEDVITNFEKNKEMEISTTVPFQYMTDEEAYIFGIKG